MVRYCAFAIQGIHGALTGRVNFRHLGAAGYSRYLIRIRFAQKYAESYGVEQEMGTVQSASRT